MNTRNKKVIYSLIGILAVILVTIGITYAYWLITKNQTNKNLITSACLDISLTNEENDITLTNQFPLSDTDGMKLTPYEFTVTNNCNTSVDYQINLEAIGDSETAVKASSIKALLDQNNAQILAEYTEKDITTDGAYEARLLGTGTLTSKDTEGSSARHSLRIWIDENAPISEMKKIFKSKITVTIGQGIVAGNTLATLILEDSQTNNYLYTTTPDFSIVTSDGEYGLYTAQDDYGTSYYFRGDVENNYVKFGTYKTDYKRVRGYYSESSSEYIEYATLAECNAASSYNYNCSEYVYEYAGKDMFWRIVRINGDGTIRLVYDGTSAVVNGDKHTAIIGKSAYNLSPDNEKYIGYTYDDGTGTQVDSTIKGVVDKWYTDNLEKDYGKYVADSIFCNDREVTSTETAQINGHLIIHYGAYERLSTNKSPILTCTNQSDRYTVEDTTKGNGLLTKPIGLITADEVSMVGVLQHKSNKNTYLYNGVHSCTMSPSSYFQDSNGAYVWYVRSTAGLYYSVVSNDDLGVRPVINLKANILFAGSGTIDNPYKLVI